MSRQLLIETRMNSLSLQEGVKPKNPHCLGTIKGPCADYKNKTRNGNFYSRRLWENVFKDPLVKESLEDNVLIGELDHPGDRLETKAVNACIVMTDYEFDDNEGEVIGTFDILDTPNGKILKSLLDYGCKMGVSSRGEGDVTEVDGQNNIDEDTYYFVAFDAVVLPAVKSAKPALAESLQKRQSLKESLEEQIKSATTLAEVNTIKKVVEAVEMPELDSMIESINIKSKELEGSTDSSNLIEDISNLAHQIDELKQENTKLKESVVTYKDRLTKSVESCKRKSVLIDEHLAKSEELKQSLKDQEKDTLDLLKESSEEASRIKIYYENRLNSLSEDLDKSKAMIAHKDSRISDLENQLSVLKEELINVAKSAEMFQEDSKNKDAKVSNLKDLNKKLRDTVSELREQLEQSKVSNTNLSEKYESEIQNIKSLNESKISSLSNESNKKLLEFSTKSKSLEDEISSVNTKLTESNKKLKESYEKIKSYSEKLEESDKKIKSCNESYALLLDEFINLKSQVSGVDSQYIRQSIKPGSSAEDVSSLVEAIIDRQDRYRTIQPYLSDPVFEEESAVIVNKKTPEEQAARSFIEQTIKLL